MKKLIIILALILFALPVFAEYKPIPVERRAEYKKELEQYIKREIPVYRRNIDKEFDIAQKTYTIAINDKNNDLSQYIQQLEFRISAIDAQEFDFYRNIVVITMKYVEIESYLPQTDWVGDYINFIKPYLINNNINSIRKIDCISLYAQKNDRKILNLIKKLKFNL